MNNMPRNLYIADMHVGHENILYLDNRPFQTVEEMNETLKANWAKTVNPEDTVYILGDLFWHDDFDFQDAFLASLPGKKILIQGNHDAEKNYSTKCLDGVYDYLELTDGVEHVVLSHYPMISHHEAYQNSIQLYGHVHNSYESSLAERVKHEIEHLYQRPYRAYNIGAMMPWMAYTPRTLDEITKNYEKCRLNQAYGHDAYKSETCRMMTLSTGHLSEKTAEMLDREPDLNLLGLSVYPKGSNDESFGWFVYLPSKIQSKWPDDLKRCAARAQAHGCSVLCFDSDGPEDPSLKIFNW